MVTLSKFGGSAEGAGGVVGILNTNLNFTFYDLLIDTHVAKFEGSVVAIGDEIFYYYR